MLLSFLHLVLMPRYPPHPSLLLVTGCNRMWRGFPVLQLNVKVVPISSHHSMGAYRSFSEHQQNEDSRYQVHALLAFVYYWADWRLGGHRIGPNMVIMIQFPRSDWEQTLILHSIILQHPVALRIVLLVYSLRVHASLVDVPAYSLHFK
jgi:hypothetical protein